MIAIRFKVRDSGGAYVTATIGGKRASSTCSARSAAESLGRKIFGQAMAAVEENDALPGDDHTVTRWRIVAEAKDDGCNASA